LLISSRAGRRPPNLNSFEVVALVSWATTSRSPSTRRFGKQDFRYVAEDDVYICPAGETLAYHYTNEEHGLVLHRYWTNACQELRHQVELNNRQGTKDHPMGA
jgi:hypothetical protein